MENKIKEMLVSVEKAASKRDVNQLAEFLHQDYRVVANRFKGSKTVTIISKKSYLEMMKDGKIGGTSYDIKINDIKIFGHTGVVDILYISAETSDMHKYLILIQDENNQWKIISDIPYIIE